MHRFPILRFLPAAFAACSMTVPAFAVDMQVGSQTVPSEEMIAVQVHCNDLVRAEETTSGAAGSPGVVASGGNTGPEGGQVSGDPAGSADVPAAVGEGGAAGSTVGQDDAPSVDLAAITIEDCKAAGLVSAP